MRLTHDKRTREFTVAIEDEGIGQSPESMHKTLLSLGTTTKADKWYLIGVFGQGGSSAYAISKYSWLCWTSSTGSITRRKCRCRLDCY